MLQTVCRRCSSAQNLPYQDIHITLCGPLSWAQFKCSHPQCGTWSTVDLDGDAVWILSSGGSPIVNVRGRREHVSQPGPITTHYINKWVSSMNNSDSRLVSILELEGG